MTAHARVPIAMFSLVVGLSELGSCDVNWALAGLGYNMAIYGFVFLESCSFVCVCFLVFC